MNVKILTTEVYHPQQSIENAFYLDHFRKQGKDIKGLLRAFGREKRYVIDNKDENTLTMGIEVAKKVLERAGLDGKDIDMIVFSSQMPEYTIPSQALIVHGAIDGKESAMCMDTNSNCAGMLYTVDNISRTMMSNPYVKRAMIIGSDYVSIHCRADDEMTLSNFGDGASAVILEKTEEDCGLIDSTYKTFSKKWDMVKFPACGSSSIYDHNLHAQEMKILWRPFDGSFIVDHIVDSMNLLLDRNHLTKEDISALCFSQYAKSILLGSSERLEIEFDKFVFVGDEYGYTGTSSPFITLHKAVETGKVKRQDIVAFWTVGTNWTTCCLLWKY